MAKKKIKTIRFLGARWFQKTYGNTYHKVKVYVNGKLIGTSPEKYGYGSQYVQTGKQMLKDKGYFSTANWSNWKVAEQQKIKIEDSVVDYPLKRDFNRF